MMTCHLLVCFAAAGLQSVAVLSSSVKQQLLNPEPVHQPFCSPNLHCHRRPFVSNSNSEMPFYSGRPLHFLWPFPENSFDRQRSDLKRIFQAGLKTLGNTSHKKNVFFRTLPKLPQFRGFPLKLSEIFKMLFKLMIFPEGLLTISWPVKIKPPAFQI